MLKIVAIKLRAYDKKLRCPDKMSGYPQFNLTFRFSRHILYYHIISTLRLKNKRRRYIQQCNVIQTGTDSNSPLFRSVFASS